MFLGGNTNIPVGSGSTFTLNRDDLALIAVGLDDGYFGDKGYWREVLINFEAQAVSTNTNITRQRKTLLYTDMDTALISFSSSAIVGEWQLRDVTIIDRDMGRLIIKSSQIPNIELYNLTIQ